MAITNNFGSGATGSNYKPNTFDELGQAIGKVALQRIKEVTATNPFAVFDKEPVENGDTIEQGVVKLVEAQGYDPTGAGAMTRSTAEKMAVRYFKNWQRHKYQQSVDISMLRKILLAGGKGAENVAGQLVSVLGESDTNDKYQSIKSLLVWATTTASYTDTKNPVLVNKGSVPLVSGARDYKGILKKIKNVISQMKYVSTDCNRLGIKRRTLPEDIYVIMNYELRNSLDVDELAGVFNLSKDELQARIIETDDIAHNYVYIVDQNAILDYRRLYEMADQKNADGLFWNYFLHTEYLFGVSPLFDACFFEYDTAQ